MKNQIMFDEEEQLESQDNPDFIFPNEFSVPKGSSQNIPKYVALKADYQLLMFTTDSQIQIKKRHKELHLSWHDSETITMYEYESIKQPYSKTTKNKTVGGEVYVVFFIKKYEENGTETDADHVLFTVVFYSDNQHKRVLEHLKHKIRQRMDFLQNLTNFNYLGIEKNLRIAYQYVIFNDRPKRQLYHKITHILDERKRDKKIVLSAEQNRLMLKALMSDHDKIRKIYREQMIEAYDIEKNLHGFEIVKKNIEKINIKDDFQIQGYSEKRKMDGVVIKYDNEERQEMSQIQRDYPEELFLDNIPFRKQYEIHRYLFPESKRKNNSHTDIKLQWFSRDSEKMQECSVQEEEKGIWQGPLKIPPAKEYSLFSRADLLSQFIQKAPSKQVFDGQTKIAIESVKFLYRLMKVNSENPSREGGKLAYVLDVLKDHLTSYDGKFPERSSIFEMIKKAHANYLKYKKTMHI